MPFMTVRTTLVERGNAPQVIILIDLDEILIGGSMHDMHQSDITSDGNFHCKPGGRRCGPLNATLRITLMV